MSRTDLRPLDHQRAAFAQRRVRFQQHLPVLKQLEFEPITIARRAPRIDVQREVLARREPVFFAGLEDFPRLANDFKLIVAERPLQRSPKLMHLRRRRRRMGRIRGHDQAAPDVLASARAWKNDAK